MKKALQDTSGQVLLIVVLLLATTLTIVMTVVFTSRTETKIAKLQQDADRSLAAAEAGLEAGIKNLVPGETKSFAQLGGSLNAIPGIDLSHSTIALQPATNQPTFISPQIKANDQYTVYLKPYANGVWKADNAAPSSINIYYGSGNSTDCNQLGLEASVIADAASLPNGSQYSIQRTLGDPGKNFTNIQSGGTMGTAYNCSDSNQTVQFWCEPLVVSSIPASAKLLILRVLATNSTIKTQLCVNTPIPPQGNYYISEAKTTSGVTKKIQLFESYPQIPASVFVTSFNQTSVVN